MTEKQMFKSLITRKDPYDRLDYQLRGITKPEKIVLPKNFSLEEKFEPNHQGSRGSCSAQGQAHHKERQENKEVSARYIMIHSKILENNKKEWGYNRLGFKAVNKFGVCDQDLLPEPNIDMSWLEYINKDVITYQMDKNALKHKSKSYWRVDIRPGYTRGWEEIKQAIYKNKNSVCISMPWYKSYMQTDSQGVLPRPINPVGGHLVDCCGWKDDMLLVKNSWGINYGINGFFYTVPDIHKIWDAWTSLDIPEDLPVDFRYNEKRTWTKYLLEKKFAFNAWLIKRIGRLPNNREIKALTYGFWDMESVFFGKVGDRWLYMTKPAYELDKK